MTTTPDRPNDDSAAKPPSRKASVFQVAATMFCGIFAIGAKGTWHRDGATVTFAQVVIAAVVTLLVLVTVLSVIVWLATG